MSRAKRRPRDRGGELREQLRTAQRRCKFLAKLLRTFVVLEARLEGGVDPAEIAYLIRLGRAVLRREGIPLPRRSALVAAQQAATAGES